MTMTVGDVAEAARAAGMTPAVLLEGVLRALEDDARVDAERSA